MIRIEYFDENWGVRSVMVVSSFEVRRWCKILKKGGYVITKQERV